METRVITLVPSKLKTLFVQTEKGDLETTHPEEVIYGLRLAKGEKLDGIGKRLEIFLPLDGAREVILLGVMGGSGQELFFRALELGISCWRTSISNLQKSASLEKKSSALDRAEALKNLWKSNPEKFYPLLPAEREMAILQLLSRDRLFIQNRMRKPVQLRFYSALRRLRYLLPLDAEPLLDLIYEATKDMFRNKGLVSRIEKGMAELEKKLPEKDKQFLHIVKHFATPRFILAMEEEEREEIGNIEDILGTVPIAQVIRSAKSGLPQIKGLGPALLAGFLGEIGDIRRFPDAKKLRGYARQHLIKDSESGNWVFPARRSGAGPTNWSRDLHQVIWLLAATQVPRYEHVWKLLYEWRKAIEIQRHPEPIPRHVVDRQGRDVTIYDYSLKHLDSRAKRWVASKILEYLFGLWKAVAGGQDPEIWYEGSAWPVYFAKVEKGLEDGLADFLKTEIPKRRRQGPKEETEEAET